MDREPSDRSQPPLIPSQQAKSPPKLEKACARRVSAEVSRGRCAYGKETLRTRSRFRTEAGVDDRARTKRRIGHAATAAAHEKEEEEGSRTAHASAPVEAEPILPGTLRAAARSRLASSLHKLARVEDTGSPTDSRIASAAEGESEAESTPRGLADAGVSTAAYTVRPADLARSDLARTWTSREDEVLRRLSHSVPDAADSAACAVAGTEVDPSTNAPDEVARTRLAKTDTWDARSETRRKDSACTAVALLPVRSGEAPASPPGDDAGCATRRSRLHARASRVEMARCRTTSSEPVARSRWPHLPHHLVRWRVSHSTAVSSAVS